MGAPLLHSDPSAAMVEKTEQAKPVKKVKRHNHMEEKINMPMTEPESDASKKETPKKRHDHTKEKH